MNEQASVRELILYKLRSVVDKLQHDIEDIELIMIKEYVDHHEFELAIDSIIAVLIQLEVNPKIYINEIGWLISNIRPINDEYILKWRDYIRSSSVC